MAKQKVGLGASKKHKAKTKVSDDNATKSLRDMQPPDAVAISDSYGKATWDALLADAPEPDSMELYYTEADSTEPMKKPKRQPKKKNEAETETAIAADGGEDAGDGGAMSLAIDTGPTPVELAFIKTKAIQKSLETKRPYKVLTNHPSGLNHRERRRLKLIEDRRAFIKEYLGISKDSQHRADEVQERLDAWIKEKDEKDQARVLRANMEKERKKINKENRKRVKQLADRARRMEKEKYAGMNKKEKRQAMKAAQMARKAAKEQLQRDPNAFYKMRHIST